MESASLTGTCSPLPSAGVWNEAVSSPRRLRVGTGGAVCASVFTRVISERFTDALQERLTIHVHILGINGESCCLKRGRENAVSKVSEEPDDKQPSAAPTAPASALCGAPPHSIPYVVQVGHNYSVPLAHILGAIDRRIRKVGRPIALVFWMSGFVPIPRRSTPGNWSCCLGAFTYF